MVVTKVKGQPMTEDTIREWLTEALEGDFYEGDRIEYVDFPDGNFDDDDEE